MTKGILSHSPSSLNGSDDHPHSMAGGRRSGRTGKRRTGKRRTSKRRTGKRRSRGGNSTGTGTIANTLKGFLKLWENKK